jgi:RNA 2',3'-cyclic 3'-phosphodiesterase
MTDPITTIRTRSTSTAGSSHRGARFTMTAYEPAGKTDPRWVMRNDALRAELLSERARAQRTGLARTHEGAKRSGGPGSPPGDPMRLFVAIAPPPAVLDELDALAGPLRASRHDLRWTSREAWHVTLAFLGQVDETAVARLLPRLERAARRHHSFRLAFCGAGAFPSPARANVLWSGLSGDRGALARLAESVAAGASRAGAAPPDKGRRFQPHLTLARCRLPADVTELVAALAGYQGQPWTADRVHLVRSRLGAAEQPRYATLASWPLRIPDRDADPAG